MRSLLLALVFAAQAIVDPTGHWEGTIELPGMVMQIEIDLTKNANGDLAGTFTQPADGVKGLPLSIVTVDGRSVRFVLRGGEGISTFEAILAIDGKSMSGDVTRAGESARFTLARTADARIVPAPKSAPIRKELEGTWKGSLNAGGKLIRIVLTMANQADGTAMGTVMSPDGTGMEIPVGITQKASSVTIDVPSVGVSFVGVLNAAGTELAGTWRERTASLPLTFKR